MHFIFNWSLYHFTCSSRQSPVLQILGLILGAGKEPKLPQRVQHWTLRQGHPPTLMRQCTKSKSIFVAQVESKCPAEDFGWTNCCLKELSKATFYKRKQMPDTDRQTNKNWARQSVHITRMPLGGMHLFWNVWMKEQNQVHLVQRSLIQRQTCLTKNLTNKCEPNRIGSTWYTLHECPSNLKWNLMIHQIIFPLLELP